MVAVLRLVVLILEDTEEGINFWISTTGNIINVKGSEGKIHN